MKQPIIEVKEKRKKKKNFGSYSRYIHQILKQVHPDLKISKKSMAILESFLFDMFERITKESTALINYNKKKTLTNNEIETSIKFLFPEELFVHSREEMNKALTKFNN